MDNFTLLSPDDKNRASIIAQHILINSYYQDRANICCYGNFVNDNVVMDDRLRGLLANKAIRAIHACGGDVFEFALVDMACQPDKQAEFIDHIAYACFLQSMAWAGKPVMQNVQ